MRVLVVVPTYNECDNVGILLPAVRAELPGADVLVVDDNSPDGTGDRVEELVAELGQITLLRRSGKQGLGSAYRTGFDYGLDQGYDVVVSMDVDLSHDPEVLPQLLRMIEAGADAVIGSRYVPGGATVDWPLHRRVLSRWGNRYASLVLRLQVRDCTSGYRAYRGRGAQGDRSGVDECRRLCLPHRAGPPPRARQPTHRRDTDRVSRSPLRRIEDVRPHRRRVDVARHHLGPPRCPAPLARTPSDSHTSHAPNTARVT